MERLESRTLLAVITEFPLATAGSLPGDIVLSGDGNFWFTEFGSDRIGRITPTGVITDFALPVGRGPTGIAAGPDGLIYFTEQSGDRIGRINPLAGSEAAIQASIVEFVVPGVGSAPTDITSGPDGAMWFTESGSDQIGRITTAGLITNEFVVPGAGSAPTGITAGPDGALWFTETLSNEIGRITTTGILTEFEVPGGSSNPNSIATGADGALWFTQFGSDQIGRLTTGGAIVEFALNNGAAAQGITAGPDGKLYFAESGRDRIGRITTAGAVSELGEGIAPGSAPTALAFAGNTLFFTEQLGNQIGRLGGDAVADAGTPITILTPTPNNYTPNTSSDLSSFNDAELENLYVFRSPTNANNTVFTLTSNALAGIATPTTFDPTRVYALNVDRSGDALEDFRLLAKFSAVDANGAQTYVLQRVGARGLGVIAHGNTGSNLALPGGGTTRAGLQDDPFFFDQVGFDRLVNNQANALPRPVGTAENFYGPDKNVLSVVVELPSAQIGAVNSLIGTWGTLETANDGGQIDRVGRPLIDTLLIPPIPRGSNFPVDPSIPNRAERRFAFAQGDPATDVANFNADMVAVLTNFYGRNAADANAIASLLLPDMLIFQIGNPNGFGTFVTSGTGQGGVFAGTVFGNGRRLTDDVVDIELNILTNGGITTDNVADDNTPLVNDAPVANPDSFTTVEDTVLNVPFSGVLGNDIDIDGPAQTAVLVADVANGILNLNLNGSFTYTPNLDFVGADSFTYQVNDTAAANNLSNIVTVTITVIVAPPPPPPAGGLPECQVETLNSPGNPGTATLEDDADNPGQNVLIVTGTSGNDVIVIEPKKGQLRVTRNGKTIGTFAPSDVPRIVAFGLMGNDKIVVNGSLSQPATLFGNEGNDQLFGARGADGLEGGSGTDRLFGGSNNDTLCGGNGNDFVYGQAGNDFADGDAGNDKVFGEAGNDFLLGNDGNDHLFGGTGNDRMFGQAGNDQVFGESGNDVGVGGDGNDKLFGGSGRDVLIGGDGLDTLFGETHDDILVAGSTSHDEDDEALRAILAEWTSTHSYTTRVDNLRNGGGQNGIFTLDDTTVSDDGLKDTLYGDGGLDWFLFGDGDRLKDIARNELVN